MTRKIIQLQVFDAKGGSTEVWALCDDGTVWMKTRDASGIRWIRVDTTTLEQTP